MQKTYVLDTNVLIQSPEALGSFEENRIVLPLAVLEELDGLKNADGEKGRNARQVIRALEELRTQGDLTRGVALPGGGSLRLEVNHVGVRLPDGMDPSSRDNRILKVCRGLWEDGTPAVLVTRDIVARIKAQMMGIPAEDFRADRVPEGMQPYTGRREVWVPDRSLDELGSRGLRAGEVYVTDAGGKRQEVELTEHEFLLLRSDTDPKKTRLGRYARGEITRLRYGQLRPFGVRPRNVGQQFLQEALMLPAEEAPLVIVQGPAGTAKTFYTLAAGLEQVLEQTPGAYRKLLICRPNAQFDQDIGFLPGDEKEKISPLLRPVMDNLENLLGGGEVSGEQELRGRISYLFDAGVITAEALNFMRGRSIADTWLMIDEAQNLTPRQAKGIITRVGKGTKVILLGDPDQIDNPLLGRQSNGLSYAAAHMKGSGLCVQLTMQADECERSALALDAARRM